MTPCILVGCTRFQSNVLLQYSLFFLTLGICVCICIHVCIHTHTQTHIHTHTHTHTHTYIYIYIYIYQNKRSRNHIFTVMQRHSCFEALPQICRNRKVASSCLSVCPSAWKALAPAEKIFVKFYSGGVFCWKDRKKFNFGYNLTKISGTFCEDLSIRMTGLVTCGTMV